MAYDTMWKPLSTITLVFVGLILSGCASPSFPTGKAGLSRLGEPVSASRTAGTAASSPTPAQANAESMQDIMAELQCLGTLDPAARDKLMEDLRQSDPSLWPLVMQQFRATLAYRRRAAERTGATERLERLPAIDNVAAAPVAMSSEAVPAMLDPPPATRLPTSPTPPNQVMQVSYAEPVANDGRQRLAEAIEALEAEVPPNPTTPAEIAQHARLRMLYAAVGRREDALRPIPGAPPESQQFMAKELDGLSTWLDAERTPDVARRAAETMPVLAEALAKLAEATPLVVRNLAFCTEVQSYGCTKRFDKYEFQPNQEVLLYAEVENFASESTAKGYHTALKSSYQILDSRGQRVAEQAFAATEEHCQNPRRDFFIGFHLRLPKRIDPGKYTLRLSIEDLKCPKAGQASLDFSIKEGKEAKEKS